MEPKFTEDEMKAIVSGLAEHLTESDEFIRKFAAASAKAQHDALMRQIYSDLGQGLWKMLMQGLVIGILAVAAYGATSSFTKLPWSH